MCILITIHIYIDCLYFAMFFFFVSLVSGAVVWIIGDECAESTRFPLAEYRYGREEMLSLYDKNFKMPELLPKYNKLYIEKMQCPLALLPPSADEETVSATLFFYAFD